MTSRDEFEIWADKNNLLIDKDSDGFYTFDAATVAWWAWQASREQAEKEIERLNARVKELEDNAEAIRKEQIEKDASICAKLADDHYEVANRPSHQFSDKLKYIAAGCDDCEEAIRNQLMEK